MRRLLPIGAGKSARGRGMLPRAGRSGWGIARSRSMAGDQVPWKSETRPHKIAREAATCLSDIDETIPVLLEMMALGEATDIGPTLQPVPTVYAVRAYWW